MLGLEESRLIIGRLRGGAFLGDRVKAIITGHASSTVGRARPAFFDRLRRAHTAQKWAGSTKAEDEITEAEVEIDEQSMEQQKLMDESGRMLEYLRKEVFKLRSQNQQLRTDFDLLKDNNQRLMDANASAGASFAALNQHAKHLSKENAQLVNEVSTTKSQMQKIQVLQTELKEELRMKQLSYVGEVQSRFQYQKALQQVADLIEANCRDYRLVQQVLEITDEVEMEHMTAGGNRVSHENGNDPGTGEQRSSIFSYLNPFSS